MLHKENFYGTEGIEQPPEEKARVEEAWLTSILEGIETGKLKVLTNKSEGRVIVYEVEADEERNGNGEIDPARVIWMTDIEDFKKFRAGKIIDGISLPPKKEKEH